MREARRKAAAEIAERASAVFQGDEPLRRASFRELGSAAIHPDAMLLFSDRQRRRPVPSGSPMLRVPPSLPPDQPIAWALVRRFRTGQRIYVPASMVYFKYPGRETRTYCPTDSSGLAAGRSRTDATLRGLLELVERDSVALWWYNRIRCPPFAQPADPVVARLLDWYAGLKREVRLLDLTSDLGIPVCAALSFHRGSGRDLAFGFGAGLTRTGAVRHALLEMTQPLATRAAGWWGGEGTAPFERWRRGLAGSRLPAWLVPSPRAGRTVPPRSSFAGTASAQLARCSRALEARGLVVFVRDLTRPGCAFRVVRVIVPGLRHLWPRFAPGRLYRAPVAAGWSDRIRVERTLNPVPLLL